MKAAPNPREIQHIQFKQSTPRQICDSIKTIPSSCSLITTDCKRGLIYIGHENKITVVPSSDKSSKSQLLQHTLTTPISRISLSCDYSYLSVTLNSTAHIYNASSLSKQSLELLHEIQFSSSPQPVFAYDLKWNPSIPGSFCTIASDSSIGSFSVKFEQKSIVSVIALEKIQGLEATCIAWSPKGKQIVIGCKNGSIIQLKPELKVARSLPGPSPSIGEALAITWISNYQFCAAYSDPNDHRMNMVIIDAPKGEIKATFTNYEDITFGMFPDNNEYLSRYYFEHIPEWNVIIAASSFSSEIAILGSNDNGVTWEQWLPIDSGRAQLPCIGGNETYPLGITIDKTPQQLLPWDEDTLPHPMPMLHIFGTSGGISSFSMINLIPNCPTLCSVPWEPVTIAATPLIPSAGMMQPQQTLASSSTASQEQNNRLSLLPSEISFAMNSAATSTPRGKQNEFAGVKPQLIAGINLLEDRMKTSQVSGTSALGQACPAPPPAYSTPAPAYPSVQPVVPPHVDLRIPKPRVERAEPVEVPHKEIRPIKEDLKPQEKPIYDESICLRVYKEEENLFENELKQKLEPLVWECGSEEDKQKLITQSKQIEDFLHELEETTSSLSSDISYLKALLLQSFVWIEETKSRNSANYNDASRDRHDKCKIKQLERLYLNTQTQLIQATKALDMNWAECQSRDKLRMKIPSLEFVYQSLKCHSEIIAKEKANLEGYIQKWKHLSKNGKSTSLNRSMSKLSLGKGSSASAVDGEIDGMEMRCRTIANNTKNFSRDKQMKLRDILMHTKTRVVKTIDASPVQERLEATLSSLASLSPVPVSAKPRTNNLKSSSSFAAPPKPSIPSIPSPSPSPVTSAAPSVEKSVPSSPLASLNSIVAQIGGAGAEAKGNSIKSQPIQFSMGSSFSQGFDPASKPGNPQLGKPGIQMPGLTQSASSTQLPPAFSKVINVSFGLTEQKSSVVPNNSRENTQKSESVLSFSSKDPPIPQSTSTKSLFSDTLFNTSAMSIIKTPNPPAQPSTLGSGTLSISLKDTPPATTTQSVFSFANSPTFSTTVSPSATTVDLSGLTVGLSDKTKTQTTPATSMFGKSSAPASSIDFGKVGASVSSPEFKTSSLNLPAGTSIEKKPASPVSSLFGSTSKMSGSIFGGQSGLSTPIFGDTAANATFSPATLSPSTLGTPPVPSSSDKPAVTSPPAPAPAPAPIPAFGAASPFSQTSAAPTTVATTVSSGFGGSPGFGMLPSAGMSSINFGKLNLTSSASSTPPTSSTSIFGMSASSPQAPSTSSIFGQVSQAQSAAAGSIFGKSSTGSTNPVKAGSIFGQSSAPPVTTAQSSIFGSSTLSQGQTSPSTPSGGGIFGSPSAPASNNPIFGGISASPSAPAPVASIFGGGTGQNQSEGGSIFGNTSAASPAGPFGSPTSPSMFGGGAKQQPASNIFGGSATFGSSMGAPTNSPTAVPAFGGAPAFGAKSIFGAVQPVFGSPKPEFGGNAFGGQSTFGTPGGFNTSPTNIGAPAMGKVFGSPGNSTFESLAGQNGAMTFGSLAQKSPEKPPPPAFSGGSSFSSWR